MRIFNTIPLVFLFFVQILCAEEVLPSQTIDIPMRDGVLLPTDLYLPKEHSEKLPCVLIRSPAGRNAKGALEYLYLTSSGYLVAIQETRSSIDKEGKTMPYLSDGWLQQQDGYDTVEWLGKSQFTNGKIGTVGFSALGITQMLMAPTAPSALKCQYIGMAAASLYHDAIFPGGQFLKNQVEGWLGVFAHDPKVRQFVCTQCTYNTFWSNFDTRAVANKVKTPALHYGGWYDIFIQGTLDGFVSRQEQGGEGARGNQKLVIGPWVHRWPHTNTLGDFEVPETGKSGPMDVSVLYWLDYHLKGKQNHIKALPAVTYYVMGPFDGTPSSGHVWKHSEKWPVASEPLQYFLSPGLHLDLKPSNTPTIFSYAYDANDPVPTIGGRNLFLESGPKDQRPIEGRKDVLVFTSAPLAEDTEITGRIIATLYVASTQQNGDFSIRLCDVYPDGKSILIAEGLKNETQLSKEPKPVEIDLWSTSMVFAKGHCIRMIVTSSNYPQYEKNPNNAIHEIYADRNHPSSVTLPFIKATTLIGKKL